tara:strand:- start:3232 stop:4344 length:1113 start_codon:yes stop_codon:yes gene_type:complete
MSKRLKIFFIIPTLTAGGAERIMSYLAENLDDKKFDSKLIVIGNDKNPAYTITKSKVLFLNKSRVLAGVPKLFSFFQKEKPNIVISSIIHLNATMGFVSIFFPKITFVGRQSSISHIDAIYNPKKQKKFPSKSLAQYKVWVVRWALHKLDSIICQSEDMKTDCMNTYGIESNKLHVIHNPITGNPKPVMSEKNSSNGKLQLIMIGRLVKIKGHERILNVLSRLTKPYRLTIIGKGPEYENIFSQINELGLKSKVRYIEFTNEVEKYLAESDYYLQGSYAEGFPNALLESCTMGTPVIAFDAPGGTREIIEHNRNGYIVKNEDDFLFCLNNLGKIDPQLVIKSVMEKFEKNIILEKYANFFCSIIKPSDSI